MDVTRVYGLLVYFIYYSLSTNISYRTVVKKTSKILIFKVHFFGPYVAKWVCSLYLNFTEKNKAIDLRGLSYKFVKYLIRN